MEKVEFRPGDTVKVTSKIKEGNRERLQSFQGIVIARRGSEQSETFTVRKIGVGGTGVERIWPLNSPNLQKIEVVKKGQVRRAKLYYLRDRIGREAKKV